MLSDLKEILITEEEIKSRIAVLGKQITEDFQNKDLFVMSVLKGSVIFLADIVRQIHLPLEFGFVTISTYKDSIRPQNSPTVVNSTIPNIRSRDVLLVEDILDTGATLKFAVEWTLSLGASGVKTCVLVAKEGFENCWYPNPDYIGFKIPNRFVVGYGLDCGERYRNLPCIGVLPRR